MHALDSKTTLPLEELVADLAERLTERDHVIEILRAEKALLAEQLLLAGRELDRRGGAMMTQALALNDLLDQAHAETDVAEDELSRKRLETTALAEKLSVNKAHLAESHAKLAAIAAIISPTKVDAPE